MCLSNLIEIASSHANTFAFDRSHPHKQGVVNLVAMNDVSDEDMESKHSKVQMVDVPLAEDEKKEEPFIPSQGLTSAGECACSRVGSRKLKHVGQSQYYQIR